MPNHITNRLELIGSPEHIDDMVLRFGTHHKAQLSTAYDGSIILRSKAGNMDFRWLKAETGEYSDREGVKGVGIPEGFEIEIKDSFFEFPDCAKVITPPDHPAYHDLPSQDEARHSQYWWMTWNVANWGTKWGSYSCKRLGITRFAFETAWSAPHPIIAEMAKRCPKVHIIHTWADEDTGFNCGVNNYNSGKLTMSHIPEGGSIDAYQIAFDLDPDLASNYQMVDGKYQYVED